MANAEIRRLPEGARVGRFPLYLPMKPTSATRPPSGRGWRFEPKWDGFRALAYLEGGRTRLLSRSGLEFKGRFEELGELHRQFEGDMVVDGELLALGPGGRPDFQALQGRLRGDRAGLLSYVAFDLLHVGDEALLDLPLETRRTLLESHSEPGGRMAWSPVFADGAALLHHAFRLGLEGVVAKRLGSPYRPGTRTRDWVKIRIRPALDAVIAGWTEGALDLGFGSLVLALFAPDGTLRYAGQVGSGFSGPTIADLLARLRALERPESTVDLPPGDTWGRRRDARIHWVRPVLVCEIQYSEITRDGLLRQPSYRGLRPDKRPDECRFPRVPDF